MKLLKLLKKEPAFTRKEFFIETEDGWPLHLIRYEPLKKELKYPLLLIHGFGQNRYTWEPPGSTFAPEMAEKGVDVWIVELRGSGKSKKRKMRYDWTFDDFLKKDLPAVISYIRKASGGRKLFACGHSMGGTLLYVYSALRGRDLKGFISLGGPLYYGKGTIGMKYGGKSAAITQYIGLKPVVEYLPYFPLPEAGYIALAGYPIFATPVEKIVPLHPWHWKNTPPHRLFPRIFLGFEKVSPKLASQLVMWIDKKGLFSYDQKVNYIKFIPRIKVPFLLVAGDVDRLAPPESIEPVYHMASSKDKTFTVLKPPEHLTHWGHLDLTMGKHLSNVLLPILIEWLKKRS